MTTEICHLTYEIYHMTYEIYKMRNTHSETSKDICEFHQMMFHTNLRTVRVY